MRRAGLPEDSLGHRRGRAGLRRYLGILGYHYLMPTSLRLAWIADSALGRAGTSSACGVGSRLTLVDGIPEQVWFQSLDPVELVLVHKGEPAPMAQLDGETWEYQSRHAPITMQIKAWAEGGLIRFATAARAGP